MRWTVIILLCLAVASAKYDKKNRDGQELRDFEDSEESDLDEREFDRDSLRSSHESSESDDSDSEDDMWREPARKKEQPRKHCKNCGSPKKQTKRDPRREEDFDNDDQFYDDDNEDDRQQQQRRKPRNHNRRQPDQDEEDDGPCQPKKSLIPKLGPLNVHLTARLYQEAKEQEDDKNIVVSPIQVQFSMAALAQGARGNTKRQLNQVLDMSMPKNQNPNAYAALARALQGGKGSDEHRTKDTPIVQIKCSTNLILGQQHSARERFIEAIKTCFDGEVKKCDFQQKPQQCRDQIEQWISGKVGLKSKTTVLSRSAVTGNTKMLTVGTVQVKTNWGKQFRKNLKVVQGRFFALGEQRAATVKVLQTEGAFNYYEDEQMQVLGVTTGEKQLTVYFLLPKARHGLNRLDKHRIQYGKQLEEILSRCDSNKQQLNVQVPRFQIVHKSEEAKRVLRKLGVEDAFDGDLADFSGISETALLREHSLKYGRRQTGGFEDIDVEKAKDQKQHEGQLHLNKMIQLSTIQVDENGLDSASSHHSNFAKTKLNPRDAKDTDDDDQDDDQDSDSPERDTDQFKIDHAFAFIIKHNPTKQILLAGRVVDVAQKPVNDAAADAEE